MTMIAPPTASAWASQDSSHIVREALQTWQWSVIPLGEDKRPVPIGGAHASGIPKRLAWKAYQTRRASLAQIGQWEQRFHPPVWGVVTGRISKVMVLDFDGEVGHRTLEQLQLSPHVRTGSGGHHVYVEHPGWFVQTLNSKSLEALGRRWPGLDIRADGGYAAFCGSSTSGPYRWLRDPKPDTLALLPEDLRAFLGLLSPPERRTPATTSLPLPSRAGVSAETLLTRALQRIGSSGSGRNDAGFWLAGQLRDNGYAQAEAHAVMRTYASRVPPTNRKGEIEAYTEAEALASLASAYEQMPREPWQAPRPLTASASGGKGSGGSSTVGTGSADDGGTPSLPEIIVGGDQLRELTDQAVAAILLHEQQQPTLFLQSSRLVRIARSELKRPVVAQMGVPEVKEALTHAANFYRLKKVGGSEGDYLKLPCSPPKEIAEQILARQTQKPYLPFPPLVALVETPVIRPDGTILDQPGYDAATRLYYVPQEGMPAGIVPPSPSRDDVDAALRLIWEGFGEFPYASNADRANALGLLLTPLIRPAIRRHIPLALLDAPKQGTGKGLLSDGVSLIATGSSASILTLSERDEEVQKAITSLLLEGATIITIDNITGKLQSKHLDAVLTSDMWRGRILGVSKTAQVPQRATWIATGNNIRLGGDLARRCYRIRLDPKDSRPWLRRDFKHQDLLTWIADHRGELVCALLTLARAWFVAGCPNYDHIPMLGTFTGWAKMVGGILEHAGVPGFLSNLEKLYDEIDEECTQWETFLTAWYEHFGEDWVTPSDIVQWVQIHDPEVEGQTTESTAGSSSDRGELSPDEILPETLQFALKEHAKSFRIRLGRALEKRIDTCFGSDNLHLERGQDTHKKASRWRVVAGSGGSSFSYAQEKIFDVPVGESTENQNNKRGGENSRHSPHSDSDNNGHMTAIGLSGALRDIAPSAGDDADSPQSCELPAMGKKRVRFTV